MNVIHCARSGKDLGINAFSSQFYRVRFPLKKIALSASSRRDGDDIILDINSLRVGKCGSGFVPKVYIVRGHSRVENLKASQAVYANAWIGAHAIKKLSIQADDAISSNELAQKLQLLVWKASGGWVLDIYPFENYFIVEQNGDLFKQAYVVDPIMRNVALSGAPMKVFKEYNETPKALSAQKGPQLGLSIFEGSDYYSNTMTQEMQYDPVNNNTVLGALPGTNTFYNEVQLNYGPINNEINSPMIRTATDVAAALQIYLADIKSGSHRPLTAITASMLPTTGAAYVNACREAAIVAREAGKIIDTRDFIYWQMNNISAEGTPSSGRAKFKLGDRVKTSRGDGHITGRLTKDTVEVTHVKGGKSTHAVTEISRIITSPK